MENGSASAVYYPVSAAKSTARRNWLAPARWEIFGSVNHALQYLVTANSLAFGIGTIVSLSPYRS